MHQAMTLPSALTRLRRYIRRYGHVAVCDRSDAVRLQLPAPQPASEPASCSPPAPPCTRACRPASAARDTQRAGASSQPARVCPYKPSPLLSLAPPLASSSVNPLQSTHTHHHTPHHGHSPTPHTHPPPLLLTHPPPTPSTVVDGHTHNVSHTSHRPRSHIPTPRRPRRPNPSRRPAGGRCSAPFGDKGRQGKAHPLTAGALGGWLTHRLGPPTTPLISIHIHRVHLSPPRHIIYPSSSPSPFVPPPPPAYTLRPPLLPSSHSSPRPSLPVPRVPPPFLPSRSDRPTQPVSHLVFPGDADPRPIHPSLTSIVPPPLPGLRSNRPPVRVATSASDTSPTPIHSTYKLGES